MRKFPAGSVRKVQALGVIQDCGPCSVSDFAEALQAAGLAVKGPWKAHNILLRLFRQGLVKRKSRNENVAYTLKTKDSSVEVSRGQRKVYWEISENGEKRLEYLLSQAAPRVESKVAANRGRKPR